MNDIHPFYERNPNAVMHSPYHDEDGKEKAVQALNEAMPIRHPGVEFEIVFDTTSPDTPVRHYAIASRIINKDK